MFLILLLSMTGIGTFFFVKGQREANFGFGILVSLSQLVTPPLWREAGTQHVCAMSMPRLSDTLFTDTEIWLLYGCHVSQKFFKFFFLFKTKNNLSLRTKQEKGPVSWFWLGPQFSETDPSQWLSSVVHVPAAQHHGPPSPGLLP